MITPLNFDGTYADEATINALIDLNAEIVSLCVDLGVNLPETLEGVVDYPETPAEYIEGITAIISYIRESQ